MNKESFMMKKDTLLCCLVVAVILLGHTNLFSMNRPKKKKKLSRYEKMCKILDQENDSYEDKKDEDKKGNYSPTVDVWIDTIDGDFSKLTYPDPDDSDDSNY